MTQREMSIEEFHTILEDVLEESTLDIHRETTAKDITNWDSLNHVRLLVRIEKIYGIDLPIGEIEKAGNVGELLDVVNRLLTK